MLVCALFQLLSLIRRSISSELCKCLAVMWTSRIANTITNMELASNIAWLVTSVVAVALAFWSMRRRMMRVPGLAGLGTILLICFLLLPVISVSDDILEARQAALPLSGQTWHMASEGASVGLEITSIVSAFLALFALADTEPVSSVALDWVCPLKIAAWLTRSQHLRPPPRFAH